MRARWIVAPAVVLALGGCGKEARGPRCEAIAADLTRWLRTLDLQPRIFVDDDVRLARRADLPAAPLALAPTVNLGSEHTTYQGALVSDLELFEHRLAESRRRLEDELAAGRAPGAAADPRRLYLRIDEHATWDRVVAIVEAAHRTGWTRPSFVFALPPQPSQRPARTWVDDHMDRLDQELAENKARALADPIPPPRRIGDDCPALLRAYEAIGRDDGDGDKAEALVRSIGPALVACGCRVELPALRSQLWHMLHNPNPMRALAVEIAPDAPALALPAHTPWRDASPRLTPATGRVRLAIAP